MKHSYFTILFALIAQGLLAQIVNIPDANFKQALLDQSTVVDTNGDGEIQVSEAAVVTALSMSNRGIMDLTGIEAFTGLIRLVCFLNPISTVDISNNVQLEQLTIGSTDITTLDVSNNPALSTLVFFSTPISEIDVSNLTNLEFLNASSTDISTIDVTNNPNLLALDVAFTNITSLDVETNTNLEMLSMGATGNMISDFSFLPNLKIMFLVGNAVESIDLSQNTQLCSVTISNCPNLEFVNLNNGTNEMLIPNSACTVDFTQGAVSASSGITAQNGNPNLASICVDDVAFAEENFPNIPAQTEFVDDCNLSVTDFKAKEVRFYPNPTNDLVYISKEAIISSIKVYSMLGEALNVLKVNTRNVQLSLKDYKPGTYFVVLQGNQGQNVLRVVKK